MGLQLATSVQMIPCCVVDDHCDVIPFLHSLWRAKKLSLTNLLYFHVDSHPDLTPPAVNLYSLTNLSVLFDLLTNAEGNISEFILPLSINGHVHKIIWLHQSFCSQFSSQSLSNYSFSLGNNLSADQTIGVTCRESYYYDEGLVYDLEELESQSVHEVQFSSYCDRDFCSSSLSTLTTGRQEKRQKERPEGRQEEWILDICLDYFTVSNPFLIELKQHLQEKEHELHGYSVQEIITIIQQTVLFLSFRCSHDESCSYNQRTLSDRRNERIQFLNLFNEIMSTPFLPPADSSLFPRFLELFDCSCQRVDTHSPQSQAQLFLEMISNLSLPIRETILKSGWDLMFLILKFHRCLPCGDPSTSGGKLGEYCRVN